MKANITIFLSFLFIFLIGCKKSDNSVNPVEQIPDPVASFDILGDLETKSNINFVNTSKNADTFVWEFGDGTASTEKNPTKQYNSYGIFFVKLTATNSSTGKSSIAIKEIKIKPSKVFFKSIDVVDIPFVDANGSGWDLNSGPDVFIQFVDSVGNVLISSSRSIYYDVKPSDLPIGWDFIPELEFPKHLWAKTLLVAVWDYDDISSNELIGITRGFNINKLLELNNPNSYLLESSDGKTKIRIYFKWQ